jgi:Catalytic LigB subunit of aromatic ring-opening dioxygenase
LIFRDSPCLIYSHRRFLHGCARCSETGRVNAEFDRWFMDCLVGGRGAEVIAKYPKAEELEQVAGNGGQEVRDWLAVAGAMPVSLKPRVLAYEPIPGCGIGVMAWAQG